MLGVIIPRMQGAATLGGSSAQWSRLRLAVWTLWFCFATAATHAQTPQWRVGAHQRPAPTFSQPLRTLGAQEGLPQNTVYSMARTADGYVYVATLAGLARYDGVNFERIPIPAGDTGVWRVLADGDALWVGTTALGLWRLHGDELTEVRGAEGERLVRTLDLHPASDGSVWVASRSSVQKCRATGCTLWLRQADVMTIAETRIGRDAVVWFGLDTEGMFALPAAGVYGDDWRKMAWHLSRQRGLPANTLRAVAQWSGPMGQDVWLAMGRGLVRITVNVAVQHGFAEFLAASSPIDVWRGETHVGLAGTQALLKDVDAEGRERLVVGVFGVGLGYWYADGQYDLMTVRDGLPDNAIFCLMRSGGARGPLWVGTGNSGIVRLEPGLWKTLAEPEGLPNRSVIGIGEASFEDGSTTHWLGTTGGAVRRAGQGWQPILPPPWRDVVVHAVAPRVAGGLWLGTDAGLLSFDKGRVHAWHLDNSQLPGLAVTAITRFKFRGNERTWLATRHGVAWIEGDKPARAEVAGVDLTPGARALIAAPEIAGGSLFTLQNGVNWIRSDGRAQALAESCMGHRDVVAAAVEGQTLWLAGRGGLRRLRFAGTDFICELVAAPALADVWVSALLALPNGDLFVFSAAGAYRLYFSRLQSKPLASVRVERFGASDALASVEFRRATYLDREGRLWAANAAGAVMLPVDGGTASDVHAKLVLKGVPEQVAGVDGVLIPFGQDVNFEWRLLSFAREAHNRYRWQLEGLPSGGGDWSAVAGTRLQRLPARAYRLQVWARDANDVEYGPLVYRFTIDKPWWQRESMIVAGALALVALGAGMGRWRSRVLQQRAVQLENVVRTRTRELSQANQRLEKSAMTDMLTGALNRRALFEQHARDGRGTQAALLMDIDFFKRINDTYGHAAGDMVLKDLVKRLSPLGYPLFRLGGEEFLLLIKNVEESEVIRLCQTVLAAMAVTPVAVSDSRIDVRVSIGACRFAATGQVDALEAAIQMADVGLYRAKAAGRNRAMVASGGLVSATHEPNAATWAQVIAE